MAWLTSEDIDEWRDGRFHRPYEKLGAHPNQQGTWFCVWAPNADRVSVLGEFNDWKDDTDVLDRQEDGLWTGYVRSAGAGEHYKYRIENGTYTVDKTDPYAFAMEPPERGGSAEKGLASIVTDLDEYDWNDEEWMETRLGPDGLDRPMAAYEVHLGSWKHHTHGESYSYREIAEPLADHVEELGFTHVELMPVMEHPYYGSWGYQVVGYYAPTYRYGSPQDLMYLVDYLHQRGIGVLLDWVPAHFATDPQGLVYFDGTPLYEYEDHRMRYHPDWGTYVFDYNSHGVQNFLIGNAMFWHDKYHIDGLRFDAVASMLYRDYSRDEYEPNMFGGRENLEAKALLKKVNATVYTHFPDSTMIAEESTSWPGVSKPTYEDGLGFLYKWNMGWMHDTLEYVKEDPVHRKYHHNDLTFPLVYAFSENYTLPLSHDEVVHGKGHLWNKMPGDPWQKAANLRALFGHMVGHPGKKLLFMGSEFGQTREWDHNSSLDWHLLENDLHEGIFRWVRDLFHLYRTHPALWNDRPGSFTWIDLEDREQSVVSYRRMNPDAASLPTSSEEETVVLSADEPSLLFVFNFTPVPRRNYRIGAPRHGCYTERLNSDAEIYGGGGIGNLGEVETTPVPYHGQPTPVVSNLPPLAVHVLEYAGEREED